MVNGKLKFKFGFDSENQYFAFKIICGRISAIWDKSAPINSIKIMNFPPLSTIRKKFLAKKKNHQAKLNNNYTAYCCLIICWFIYICVCIFASIYSWFISEHVFNLTFHAFRPINLNRCILLYVLIYSFKHTIGWQFKNIFSINTFNVFFLFSSR